MLDLKSAILCSAVTFKVWLLWWKFTSNLWTWMQNPGCCSVSLCWKLADSCTMAKDLIDDGNSIFDCKGSNRLVTICLHCSYMSKGSVRDQFVYWSSKFSRQDARWVPIQMHHQEIKWTSWTSLTTLVLLWKITLAYRMKGYSAVLLPFGPHICIWNQCL